jgi:hypothetical protein
VIPADVQAPRAARPGAELSAASLLRLDREKVVVRPALAPEDAADALLTLGAALVILLELLVLPTLAWFAAGRGSPYAMPAAYTVWTAQVLYVVGTAVHWLKLDERGIHLGSWKRRMVPWSYVTAVRPAGPAEVVVFGWLWPPIPPRDGTRSLTSRGHFAIEHRGGVHYFPPADPAAFLDAVRRWAPHALGGASHAESSCP